MLPYPFRVSIRKHHHLSLTPNNDSSVPQVEQSEIKSNHHSPMNQQKRYLNSFSQPNRHDEFPNQLTPAAKSTFGFLRMLNSAPSNELTPIGGDAQKACAAAQH